MSIEESVKAAVSGLMPALRLEFKGRCPNCREPKSGLFVIGGDDPQNYFNCSYCGFHDKFDLVEIKVKANA